MSFRLGLKFFRQRRNDTKHYGRTRNFSGKCENLSRATHSARHHGSIIIFIQVSQYCTCIWLSVSIMYTSQITLSPLPCLAFLRRYGICVYEYICEFPAACLKNILCLHFVNLHYIPDFVYFKLSIFIIKNMHGKLCITWLMRKIRYILTCSFKPERTKWGSLCVFTTQLPCIMDSLLLPVLQYYN